jgi:3-hydroxyisobutyrate dehydrogenase-like beta-hydroxyacid dehydrogenase
MQVGFIGLGNMGAPMAGFVLGAGFSLMVHDLRTETASPLVERGAVWADSPRDMAAQCDVICTCVPGPPEMQAVTLGAGGIVEGVKAGAVVIDHTTNAPAVVRDVGAALTARGAHLLDAPLDGGREGALEGQLTLFVGGDEAVLRRVKPVLDTFSRSVVWVGELGAGSITKIVHNALAMSIDLLLAECLTLGAKAGVAVPRLVEAFREGCIVSQNMTFTKRMPATLFRGDFTARFALALAYKDFQLAGDLATQHGVPTRLLDLCQMELLEAMNRGWGGEDRIKASTLQEERAGVRLRM